MKNEVILYIDTANNTEIEIGLEMDGKKDTIRQPLDTKKAQVALPLIEKLLHKHKLTPSDITRIRVETGPGSFVGLRVGVSIANYFAQIFNVPINHLPVGQIVEPTYS